MKKFFLFSLIFFSYKLFGQLNDNNWLFNRLNTKTFQVDFRTSPPSVTVDVKMPLAFTKASFSDAEGNILFYTNGIQINNKSDEMMENGDSLNAGYWANVSSSVGYPVPKGAFFLLKPLDSTMCFLFHMYTETISGAHFLSKFYYSLIDMNANNGLGSVVEKNIPLLNGDAQLNFNHAVAVRHGNGRDWWIIVPHRMQPQYFRFLLTPEGIYGPEVQEVGFKEPTLDPNQYIGTSLFSPDGTKYADYDFLTGIQIFDFNRCTGLLSNPVKIDYQWDPNWNNGESGIAFSSSGRFLYMTRKKNGIELVQYDLFTTDIPASEVVIYSCNSFNNYLCSMTHPQLGPDGEIYIGAVIDTVAFHIIHQPDSLGQACEFDYGGFVFPLKYPGTLMPYFPNYRLYDLPGSPCDTLGIGPVAVEEEGREESHFHIYPNPAGGEVHLSLPAPLPT
ncbi:MAG: hypothetical protein ACE5FF_07955, partial [Saprospiraceae bacterium]